jgi:cell division septal protein FtsQ
MKTPPKLFSVLIIVLALFGAGSYLLGWSSLLTVRNVEIIGTPTSQSQNAIARALDISTGEKLARLDPRALSNRLRSFDWVQSSNVSRNWLSGKITISIVVRKPIALYSQPGKPQLALDASGKTFATPAEIQTGLPRVSAASVDAGLAAIKLFTELPKPFSENIERMSAVRADNFLIYGTFSKQNIRIIWGDGKDSQLKVDVINALLVRPENQNLRMIDVSAPHAPIVK